ncbi:aconitate hydratase [Microbulbifer sp. OS29]|uniref:Aconitate hydratase n=1 Tax=Microbulbifer okhotskensis TaxID=2926617 RepID=A0A9X2J527_9GAMM|nr:aconitate hydratase [Microbulbifer okhotskensis]MCO1334768.1 aconitate hydratase [Microbulbifer okhotskensis]
MPGMNLAKKLIESHLVKGTMAPNGVIELKIDQVLSEDATGTLVMLELEALGARQVKAEVCVQYVDHNVLRTDHRNGDDHMFLESACRKYGIWYSRPGNGISHPVHMSCFGVPGKTMLGADSHTCAAGSMSMLAIGAGGIEVALAMMGFPLSLLMPTILGVRLEGELQPWVSAKDVILELLRRYTLNGCWNKIVEYHGPGLDKLTAMDRHVIANMGQEMGAVSSVFPSDIQVRLFLRQQGREEDFTELAADGDATYDEETTIDLSKIEPMMACPSRPDKVVRVQEVEGRPVFQSYIGSSANPGLRDFSVPARMIDGLFIPHTVSLDINPSSRQLLQELTRSGDLGKLLAAGAYLHETGCGGCIGMGQAPASGHNSLRTVPRNFSGRSGTKEDQVYLCSPETATASALNGKITDPRRLDMDYPVFNEPEHLLDMRTLIQPPQEIPVKVDLRKGPNIKPLPVLNIMLSVIAGPILLKLEDNISTDDIIPGGAEALPYWSNVPELSRYTFHRIDDSFHQRALSTKEDIFLIAGDNFGHGSSREHAALTLRFLGVRCVIAKSVSLLHRKSLIDHGILILTFDNPEDFDGFSQGDMLQFYDLSSCTGEHHILELRDITRGKKVWLKNDLSAKEVEIIKFGGRINYIKGILGASLQKVDVF